MADHTVFEKVDAGVRDLANIIVKGATLGHYSADDLAGKLDANVGSIDPATRGNDSAKTIAAERAKTEKLDAEIPVAQRALGAAAGVGVMTAVVATGGAAAGVGPVSTVAGVATATGIATTTAGVAVVVASPGGLLGPETKQHPERKPPQPHRGSHRSAIPNSPSEADKLNAASYDAAKIRDGAEANGDLAKLEKSGQKGAEAGKIIRKTYGIGGPAA